MTKSWKKTLTLLEQEFQLQFITFGFVTLLYMLNLFVTLLVGSHHLDTPLTSIYFFAIVIGLTLPWQFNTKGQIELGYCRYHLSMPVRTWQLYIIPLICRLCLIGFFVMIEVMLYWIFYQRVQSLDIVHVIKIAVLIYLVLQAYSWSKISFKNLFFYLGVMFTACVLLWPVLFKYIMGWPVYFILVSCFILLAVIGVRYLRFGKILILPGLYDLFYWRRNGKEKIIIFKNIIRTQFYHEWRRSWYFMPLLTGFFITMLELLLWMHKGNHSGEFSIYVISRGWIFILMSLLVPLLGMIYLENRSFNSSYIDYMPIEPGCLSKIKMRCFSTSFALCQIIFFVWSGVRIIPVIETMGYGTLHIFKTPEIVIWLIAVISIWSWTMAFFVVSMYLRHKLMSFAIPLSLIFILINQKSIYYLVTGKKMTDDFILYDGSVMVFMFVSLMICLMIGLKVGLLLLRNKNVYIKVIFSILMAVMCVPYVFLMNKIPFFSILPYVLTFAYPVMAQYEKISCRRYELFQVKKTIPWRLIVTMGMIFIIFSGYTYFINRSQAREIEKTLNECRALKVEKPKSPEWRTWTAMIKARMPYIREYKIYCKDNPNIFGKLTNGIWNSSGRFTNEDINVLRIRLNKYIEFLLTRKQFKKAMQYMLFLLEVDEMDSWSSFRFIDFSSNLKDILKTNPPLKDLNTLNELQKRVLQRYLWWQRENMLFCLSCQEKYKRDLGFYRRWQYSSEKQVLNGFDDVFLTPLNAISNLQLCRIYLVEIKAIEYAMGHDHINILSYKLSVPLNISYNPYIILRNHNMSIMQKSIAAVAIARYQRKYGKPPVKFNELSPGFLESNELLVFYDSMGAEKQVVPVMIPNSMQIMNEFMGQPYTHNH